MPLVRHLSFGPSTPISPQLSKQMPQDLPSVPYFSRQMKMASPVQLHLHPGSSTLQKGITLHTNRNYSPRFMLLKRGAITWMDRISLSIQITLRFAIFQHSASWQGDKCDR